MTFGEQALLGFLPYTRLLQHLSKTLLSSLWAGWTHLTFNLSLVGSESAIIHTPSKFFL
jgi:hypothetical protein